MRTLARLDRWLFRGFRADPRGLALFRIFFCLYVLTITLPIASWAADLPAEFFRPPPGLGRLYPGFPSAGALTLLNAALAAATLCLLAGWRAKAASFAVAFLLLALGAIAKSPGQVHHDIFVPLIPLLFGFTNWGERYTLFGKSGGEEAAAAPPRGSPTLAIFSLLICAAMFQAGLAKCLTGWLRPDLLCTFGYMVQIQESCGGTELGLAMRGAAWPWAWKLADFGAVALEAAFLFGPFSRRRFLLMLSLACVFHFGVWALMNIPFICNVLAYAAFLDWSRAADWLEPRLRKLKPWMLHGAGATALALLAALSAYAIGQGQCLVNLGELPASAFLLTGALAFGLAYLLAPTAKRIWARSTSGRSTASSSAASPGRPSAPPASRRQAA